MAETYNVLKKAKKLKITPEFDSYTKVVIFAGQDDEGNDIIYTSGSDTGRTLEITNDWGSQEQADSILESIKGFHYQPFYATGAVLDPTSEIGDGVSINDVYSGIYTRATTFSSLMLTDISAPDDEEIEHEFTIQSPTNRMYSRFTKNVRSNLAITATQIRAEVSAREEQGSQLQSSINVNAQNITTKVSKQDSNSNNTFGWQLTSDSWTIFSGSESNTILRATKDGLEVKGVIKADTGYIGGENGFVITASAIYNNIPSFYSSQNRGVYIGTDGIRLGSGFKVDSAGNLNATSGTFGSISVSGGNTYGTYYGGLSGCGGSVSGLGGSLSSGINVGSKSIGTFVTDTITAKYGNALVGTFADLTVAGNTWDYRDITVVTSVNFTNQTYSTTRRRFWITEGY